MMVKMWDLWAWVLGWSVLNVLWAAFGFDSMSETFDDIVVVTLFIGVFHVSEKWDFVRRLRRERPNSVRCMRQGS
jgi:hypothetical protein